MSRRFRDQKTPEERLAVIIHSHTVALRDQGREADYADIAAVLAPYVIHELVLDRIAQARKSAGRVLTERMIELGLELAEAEKNIPQEHHL